MASGTEDPRRSSRTDPYALARTAPHDPVYDDPAGDPYADPYGPRHEPYGDVYGDSYSDGFDTGAPSGGLDVRDRDRRSEQHPYGDAGGRQDGFEDLDDDFDVDDDGEGEEPPRRSWTRLLIVVGSVMALLVGMVGAVGFWISRQVTPSGSPGEQVTVELTSGMSTPDIAQVLADHEVVSNARIFTFYARFRSKGDIQAGTYENLQTNMAMGDVLDVLAEGPDLGEDEAMVTPGQTVDEMMVLLGDRIEDFDEDRLRSALADEVELQYLPEGQDNPEGFLAPGEYDLSDLTEAEFVQAMADRFDELYEELEIGERAAELDIGGDVELSGYDVVIVASLIERETNHGPEKPQIARVIYNRLAADRALGIDATSCYEKEGSCFPLSSEDLQGLYSTRDEPGLPPTPIASPSEESLVAALEPAEGDWDHYVLDVEADDGSHLITSDQEEWEEMRQLCIEAGECG